MKLKYRPDCQFMNFHILSLVTSLIAWMVPSYHFYKESNTRSGFEVLVSRYDEQDSNQKEMKLKYRPHCQFMNFHISSQVTSLIAWMVPS